MEVNDVLLEDECRSISVEQ